MPSALHHGTGAGSESKSSELTLAIGSIRNEVDLATKACDIGGPFFCCLPSETHLRRRACRGLPGGIVATTAIFRKMHANQIISCTFPISIGVRSKAESYVILSNCCLLCGLLRSKVSRRATRAKLGERLVRAC